MPPVRYSFGQEPSISDNRIRTFAGPYQRQQTYLNQLRPQFVGGALDTLEDWQRHYNRLLSPQRWDATQGNLDYMLGHANAAAEQLTSPGTYSSTLGQYGRAAAEEQNYGGYLSAIQPNIDWTRTFTQGIPSSIAEIRGYASQVPSSISRVEDAINRPSSMISNASDYIRSIPGNIERTRQAITAAPTGYSPQQIQGMRHAAYGAQLGIDYARNAMKGVPSDITEARRAALNLKEGYADPDRIRQITSRIWPSIGHVTSAIARGPGDISAVRDYLSGIAPGFGPEEARGMRGAAAQSRGGVEQARGAVDETGRYISPVGDYISGLQPGFSAQETENMRRAADQARGGIGQAREAIANAGRYISPVGDFISGISPGFNAQETQGMRTAAQQSRGDIEQARGAIDRAGNYIPDIRDYISGLTPGFNAQESQNMRTAIAQGRRGIEQARGAIAGAGQYISPVADYIAGIRPGYTPEEAGDLRGAARGGISDEEALRARLGEMGPGIDETAKYIRNLPEGYSADEAQRIRTALTGGVGDEEAMRQRLNDLPQGYTPEQQQTIRETLRGGIGDENLLRSMITSPAGYMPEEQAAMRRNAIAPAAAAYGDAMEQARNAARMTGNPATLGETLASLAQQRGREMSLASTQSEQAIADARRQDTVQKTALAAQLAQATRERAMAASATERQMADARIQALQTQLAMTGELADRTRQRGMVQAEREQAIADARQQAMFRKAGIMPVPTQMRATQAALMSDLANKTRERAGMNVALEGQMAEARRQDALEKGRLIPEAAKLTLQQAGMYQPLAGMDLQSAQSEADLERAMGETRLRGEIEKAQLIPTATDLALRRAGMYPALAGLGVQSSQFNAGMEQNIGEARRRDILEKSRIMPEVADLVLRQAQMYQPLTNADIQSAQLGAGIEQDIGAFRQRGEVEKARLMPTAAQIALQRAGMYTPLAGMGIQAGQYAGDVERALGEARQRGEFQKAGILPDIARLTQAQGQLAGLPAQLVMQGAQLEGASEKDIQNAQMRSAYERAGMLPRLADLGMNYGNALMSPAQAELQQAQLGTGVETGAAQSYQDALYRQLGLLPQLTQQETELGRTMLAPAETGLRQAQIQTQVPELQMRQTENMRGNVGQQLDVARTSMLPTQAQMDLARQYGELPRVSTDIGDAYLRSIASQQQGQQLFDMPIRSSLQRTDLDQRLAAMGLDPAQYYANMFGAAQTGANQLTQSLGGVTNTTLSADTAGTPWGNTLRRALEQIAVSNWTRPSGGPGGGPGSGPNVPLGPTGITTSRAGLGVPGIGNISFATIGHSMRSLGGALGSLIGTPYGTGIPAASTLPGGAIGTAPGHGLLGLITNPAFLNSPITWAAAAAVGAGLLIHKFVGNTHLTANQWVNQFQNPFDSHMDSAFRGFVDSMESGDLDEDAAIQMHHSIRELGKVYDTKLDEYERKGGDWATVTRQARQTRDQYYGQNYKDVLDAMSGYIQQNFGDAAWQRAQGPVEEPGAPQGAPPSTSPAPTATAPAPTTLDYLQQPGSLHNNPDIWLPRDTGNALTLRDQNGQTQSVDAGDHVQIDDMIRRGHTPLNAQGNPYVILNYRGGQMFYDPDRGAAFPLNVLLGGSWTPEQSQEMPNFQQWLVQQRNPQPTLHQYDVRTPNGMTYQITSPYDRESYQRILAPRGYTIVG